jgi:hypothetical protein
MTTASKYMYCKRFKVYVSSSAIQLNRVEWVDSRHLSLRPLLLPLLSARDQEWRGVIVYIHIYKYTVYKTYRSCNHFFEHLNLNVLKYL